MAKLHDPKKLPVGFERAVNILRMPEYSSFLSGIQIMINHDKQFLFYHGGSVGLKVMHILRENGINWDMRTLEVNLEHLLLASFATSKN
ncbi:MAG: hypothetical protein KGJ59_07125 [Bacteroidota bacterium]|nr:hypothetical protein [Bacteroidota bacterium]